MNYVHIVFMLSYIPGTHSFQHTDYFSADCHYSSDGSWLGGSLNYPLYLFQTQILKRMEQTVVTNVSVKESLYPQSLEKGDKF